MLKKICSALVILVAVWGVSLVWASINKDMIINQINDNISLGMSLEDVSIYLDKENYRYHGIEKGKI